MASVQSLGVYEPAALPTLISEGILPTNPPNEAYTCHALTHQETGDDEIDEELVTTESCVVWSRSGVVERIFRFDVEGEAVSHAVFTRFDSQPNVGLQEQATSATNQIKNALPVHGELKVNKIRSKSARQYSPDIQHASGERRLNESGSVSKDLRSCRALVVVLKTQAHIFLISQTDHIVHLPFEVDSVFPTFRGILVQRKLAETAESHTTPAVPPPPQNTFSYSQSSASNVGVSFGTLDDVTDMSNSSDTDSHFANVVTKLQDSLVKPTNAGLPRLFCLLDPLAELGTVVAKVSETPKPASRPGSVPSTFTNLDSNERLLYISPAGEIREPHRAAAETGPLILAVSENHKDGTTTLWMVNYIAHDGISRGLSRSQQTVKASASRRQSSFASRLSTGVTTPVPRSHRHSSRGPTFFEDDHSDHADLLEVAFDNPGGPARSSRRVSSLLARADLSTNQDKATFSELASSHHGSKGPRKGPSFGTRSSQVAFDHDLAPKTAGPHHFGNLRASLDPASFQDQPIDAVIDNLSDMHDLKAFDDPGPHVDVHGLKREISFQKVFSMSRDKPPANTAKARETDYSIFTMQAPGSTLSESTRSRSLTLCVMNRLLCELLIFQINATSPMSTSKRSQKVPESEDHIVKVIGTRRSGITDACKVNHGSIERIVVLETKGNTLTLQAPWTSLMKIDLPAPLNLHDPYRIASRGVPRHGREGGLKRVISRGPSQIVSLRSTTRRGCIDVGDSENVKHRLSIQLQPSNPLVVRMVKICEAVLPTSEINGEPLLRGWWDAMSWLTTRDDDEVDDKEWTAFLIVLFTMGIMFTDDKRRETTHRQKRRKGSLLRSSSGANNNQDSWDEMMRHESGDLTEPEWMGGATWGWIKSKGVSTPSLSQKSGSSYGAIPAVPLPSRQTHIMTCVSLAREFAKTVTGQAAIGKNGYLPTAAARHSEERRTALATVLVALHLLREELKLDVLLMHDCHMLTPILVQLGTWLSWPNWSCQKSSFYMFECDSMDDWLFDESVIKGLKIPSEPFLPPSILKYIETITVGIHSSFITLVDLISTSVSDHEEPKRTFHDMLLQNTPRTLMITTFLEGSEEEDAGSTISRMESSGLNASILQNLPESVAAKFHTVISAGQLLPSSAWTAQMLRLVGRDDVAMLHDLDVVSHSPQRHIQHSGVGATRDVHSICSQALEAENIGAYDGSAEIDRQSVTRMLFKDDQRFAEVAKLVHPLLYPVAQCAPEPGWSEQELLEAQQELAKVMALRTLSVSLGRGLLFYNARLPLLTEKFPVHGFTLSCVMKPTDTTVTADRMVFTEDKVSWAFFHAGVEAGLSISKEAKGIDTSWILFNKPRDLTNRHAGLLLALGLNGHLRNLAKWVAFKYLTPKHNMTSIGLLLGLSASYIGTMDTLVTRLLSVHVTRMLPPGAAELNLSPLTQTCGIMGIGLLYCNTQHRRMTEIMISEMENIDVEDSANPQDTLRDEGYRLAAGFALGYVNLGRGNDLKGLHDMHITERLLTLAVATKRVDQVHITDKGTAGATIATALIFMKTNDAALARKIDVPDTVNQCEYVRPDHFLLRTVAKHLILWDAIRAEEGWVAAQMPDMYERKKIAKVRSLTSEDLPYFNILAGLCFAVGLRYAGHGDTGVRDLLCSYLDHFIRISRLPALGYDGKLARITVRNCQDLIALSVSCVMAGTGDLMILRRLRLLHGRTEAETPYGSHLAAHFAIGILFLGGGTHTFGTSNLAVGSLLCAFYPLFPATVLDNKSHLQAFRHFWVLATERRCIIPRDIDTHRPLSLSIVVRQKSGAMIQLTSPCLLPDISTISHVHTSDPEYWPITLDLASNSSHLSAFQRYQSIYLRKRGSYNTGQTSVFNATMQALNETQIAQQLLDQPFEWLFTLSAFQGFDRTERALVLPANSEDIGSIMFQGLRGTVVDDRLVMENGCLSSGRSERLWNMRLLLKFAEECEKKGEDTGWFRKKVIEGLRAGLVMWVREGC